MARSRPSETTWVALTWDDLESWAGSRSVTRGRSYQRGGHVRDLSISADNRLLATVVGTHRYATTVSLGTGRDGVQLESTCTCPVGNSCKHAVAVVAEYLQAVANERAVPIAAEEDPRWAALDDSDISEEDWNAEGDDWDEDERASPTRRRARQPSAASDASVEEYLRAKSQQELADLVCGLVRRFPEIAREFRERIALQSGDVRRLVTETRRQIHQLTGEPGWRSGWTGEGYTPDFAPVRQRLERLLELGHADEVVALGRDFLREGMQLVGMSNDEGETGTAFGEALSVVFRAVLRSSLSASDRLLFAIDAVLTDEYDAIGEASEAVLNAATTPADWSSVADALIARLQQPSPRDEGGDSFSRDYHRDQISGWVARALERSGREQELEAVYQSEARATGSYERFVRFLIEQKRFDEAEQWGQEGIAATCVQYPGIAAQLADRLREIATGRKQWDVVAAHAAFHFFDRPSPSGFNALLEATRKAKAVAPVQAAALRFLETGVRPYRVSVAPRPAPAAVRRGSRKSSFTARPEPTDGTTTHLTIDPAWPLPVPDYLVPLLTPRGQPDPEPRPHFNVLLEMAIAANRPDEVLRWFDTMRTGPQRRGDYLGSPAYSDRVAAAVAVTHPERAIEIYEAALNAQLPHAQQSAYESATRYLNQLRPLYSALRREAEWTARLASIREKYRNRPRFMELLNGLDGRTIVQSARKPRK